MLQAYEAPTLQSLMGYTSMVQGSECTMSIAKSYKRIKRGKSAEDQGQNIDEVAARESYSGGSSSSCSSGSSVSD
jgi:hypothetical protein